MQSFPRRSVFEPRSAALPCVDNTEQRLMSALVTLIIPIRVSGAVCPRDACADRSSC